MINQEIFIGVAAHKQVKELKIPFHEIICAGAIKNAELFSTEVLRDDIGSNISEKNPGYNELTVHWWMYKNIEAEWIGLCHYRRYFNFNTTTSTKYPRVSVPFLRKKSLIAFGWDYKVIRKVLSNGHKDVYVCRKESDVMPGVKSIYENHARMGLQSTVDTLMECLQENEEEYVRDAEEYFGQPNKHMFNMIIMKREHFMAYTEWLFDLLSWYENRLISKGAPLDRACGFAAEHLLNVWLLKEQRTSGLQVGELQSVFVNCTDEHPSLKSKMRAYVKYVFDVLFPYGTERRDKFKWKYMMQ